MEEPPEVLVVHPSATFRAGLGSALDSAGFAPVAFWVNADRPRVSVIYVIDDAAWERVSVEVGIPSLYVVALCPTLEADQFLQALRRGVHGVVHVDADPQTICRAVRAALTGETVLPTELAQSVAEAAPLSLDLERPLDQNELSLLQRLSDGETAVSIARSEYVSERTLRRHLDNVYLKLGVSNRQNAIKKATRMNLLQ